MKNKKKTWQICENYVYLYLTHYVTLIFFACSYICVFHLDVIKRQLKVKTEISLSTAIILNHPCSTVLCDYCK